MKTKPSTHSQPSHIVPVSFQPIGLFHANTRYSYDAKRQGSLNDSGATGFIELAGQRNFEQGCQDLSGFERVWLIYMFHQNSNWKPLTTPPRGSATKRGVFATRSPYRPNPIGISCVRLQKIDGLRVFVTEFDLLDQTPILDIKPYLPYADSFADAKIGWLENLSNEAYEVHYTSSALSKIDWLSENGLSPLRSFLDSQLEYEPLDRDRKRVSRESENPNVYILAYRTWRAKFEVEHENRKINVINLTSGYSEIDLASDDDRHGDKCLHRAFRDFF